jgi:NAD(P)-dependent dehydrogenase (short-subunit alcohol dehydrogenase family)
VTSALAGRRALVTGGAIRIGAALCREVAAMGLDVAVHYRTSAEAAERTAAECRALGVRAEPVPGDLTRADGCRAVVAEAERALGGGIDVLVNSASNFLHAPLAETTEADVDASIAINLKAPLFLSQAVAPGMTARGFGRIVNLGDVAGLEPWPRFIAHSAAKAGLGMLTRSLAQALAPEITVNAIAPGTVLMPDGSTEAAVGRAREKSVLERLGSPGDVAGALRYLLEADYVTGHTLVVDGGRLVRP